MLQTQVAWRRAVVEVTEKLLTYNLGAAGFSPVIHGLLVGQGHFSLRDHHRRSWSGETLWKVWDPRHCFVPKGNRRPHV